MISTPNTGLVSIRKGEVRTSLKQYINPIWIVVIYFKVDNDYLLLVRQFNSTQKFLFVRDINIYTLTPGVESETQDGVIWSCIYVT